MEGRADRPRGDARGVPPGPELRASTTSTPLVSLWTEHKYKTRPQWGMTIDLNSCTGCNACVVACQSENNIPVVGKDQVRAAARCTGSASTATSPARPRSRRRSFQPVPCMQCENAPCEQVCPVAATVHDAEGLNAMVYNRCIGTRYCSNNCPYKVRRFNFFNYTKDTPEIAEDGVKNPDVTVRSRGVMEKCTYCVQRLNARQDRRQARRPRRCRTATSRPPASRPARPQAIEFGDLRDPESRVAEAQGQRPRTTPCSPSSTPSRAPPTWRGCATRNPELAGASREAAAEERRIA